MDPSGPRILLNTLIAFILGSVLGVGLALLIEMLNRPIRSSSDLKELLGVPVLGTIEWRQPPRRALGFKALMAPRRLRLN
ncbi:MAG: chain length determinant protein EpsF, partial [Massilia sp.]|nr:chain length determinant protein EpsF [Massilia sp.]